MPRTRTRPSIDREQVLVAAMAYADERGVEALSMRSLAERLGVGAMTLYGYVASKDELLAGMVDGAAAEIEPPRADADPRHALAESAASAHRALLAHPWAAHHWNRTSPGPARTELMEAWLRGLADWGLDTDLVYRGYHALTLHIVGFTTQELGYRQPPGGGTLEEAAAEFLEDLDGFPHLAAHARAHLDGSDHGDEFAFVLGLILDGLGREQAARR